MGLASVSAGTVLCDTGAERAGVSVGTIFVDTSAGGQAFVSKRTVPDDNLCQREPSPMTHSLTHRKRSAMISVISSP